MFMNDKSNIQMMEIAENIYYTSEKVFTNFKSTDYRNG